MTNFYILIFLLFANDTFLIIMVFLALVGFIMFFKKWLFPKKVPIIIKSRISSGAVGFCSQCNANLVGERSYTRILDCCGHAKCEACFLKNIEGCQLCKPNDLLKPADLSNFEGNVDEGSNNLRREKSSQLIEEETNQPGNSSSNFNRNRRVLSKSHSDSSENSSDISINTESATSTTSSSPLNDDSSCSFEILKPEIGVEQDPLFIDGQVETNYPPSFSNVSSFINDGVLPSTSGSTNWKVRSSPRKLTTVQLVSSAQEKTGTISKTSSPSKTTIKVEIVARTSEPGPSKRVTPSRIAIKRPVEYIVPDTQSNENVSTDCEDYPTVAKKTKKRSRILIPDYITVKTGIEEDERKYQCNLCSKKFKTKAHIKYHRFCQDGKKPFKCGQCGQGFIAKSHYEYHLRLHSGERPHKCKLCPRQFIQRGKLTRHMKSHTGEKPFECETCGKRFANRQALNAHHLVHTGEKPFACNICGKRFRGATSLKKHTLTHTGERPHLCQTCGKSFALKWTLSTHERIHSDERPFACLRCSKAFVSRRDLKRHYRTHAGEKPYRCPYCFFSFPTIDLFTKHSVRHTKPAVVSPLSNEDPNEFLDIAPQEQLMEQGDYQNNPTPPKIKTNVIANPKFKQSIKSELPSPAKIKDTVDPKKAKLQRMIERKFKELHRRLQQQKPSKPNSSK